jgi:4-hydroxy-tetrahydrodipicolinate synthase
MAHHITGDSKGVFVITATPFRDDGAIDFDGIDQLVRFYLKCGVHGMTIMGVLGEAHKLSDTEGVETAKRFLKAVNGRVPVIVGVSNAGNANLVRLADTVMEAGAAGVMINPTPNLKTDEAVLGYIGGVMKSLSPSIPVCIQDYPQLTGVYFTASAFVQMVDAYPNIVMFKHEEAPGLRKLSAIRAACDGKARRRISILCGNSGIHLPQEYGRGADGAMTGFAYPDMLVKMHDLMTAGKADAAEDLYDKYLPVLRHEAQMGIGLALRKEILRRRGAMPRAAVRPPGPKLDATDLAELDRLLARLERRIG